MYQGILETSGSICYNANRQKSNDESMLDDEKPLCGITVAFLFPFSVMAGLRAIG